VYAFYDALFTVKEINNCQDDDDIIYDDSAEMFGPLLSDCELSCFQQVDEIVGISTAGTVTPK
jgi:hypothetical protein